MKTWVATLRHRITMIPVGTDATDIRHEYPRLAGNVRAPAFYGYGASEIYLGQALRTAGARDALVTTKVAISREFLQSGELGRCVRQSVEQSLSRLRRDAIDMLLIHNATHQSRAPYDPARESERVARIMNNYIPAVTSYDLLREGGVLEEVDKLVAAGKVRLFGLSGQDDDPAVVKSLIAKRRISLFNQTYSLMNPSAGFPAARAGRTVSGEFVTSQRELYIEFDDVIESARAGGVGVSVVSAMAAGVLTDAAARGDPPAPVSSRANRFPFEGQFDRQLSIARRFQSVAEAAGMTLAELAVRFVLSTPGVTTLVAGLSNAAQVTEVARYCDKPALTADVLARLREIWFR
jgi:aryl-alcohol dehydrogenase-like predicted oxidoreductase